MSLQGSKFKCLFSFFLQGVYKNKCELEEQLVLWDQVESGREELGGWILPTLTKLEESAQNFADTSSVETQLHKYKVHELF